MWETLELTGVALENILHRTRLSCRETLRLGAQGWYWRLRAALARQELFGPAYQVARREGRATGLPAEDLAYGETPILTAWQIVGEVIRRTGKTPSRVVDLGCGRGQVVLTARLAYGCPGWGVEVLPGLAQRAQAASRWLGLARDCQFEARDFRTGSLPEGSLYFLSPTTLEPSSWQALQDVMSLAPAQTHALSLSAPLPDSQWETLDQRRRAYSWGWATSYLQRRR